jgi:hypothetical protein
MENRSLRPGERQRYTTQSMVTEAHAAEWILDCDGSCRDVTFTPTSKAALIAFVHSLLSQYRIGSAFDNNGIDRSKQLQADDPFSGVDGYIHIVLTDGKCLIPYLQLFVDKDRETGRYCLEATFFPNDIDPKKFSVQIFRALIDHWNETIQSDDYFVRYDNASWRWYDPNDLGVIYTRKKPPVA